MDVAEHRDDPTVSAAMIVEHRRTVASRFFKILPFGWGILDVSRMCHDLSPVSH